MTPEQGRDSYQRLMDARGETVMFRRYTGVGASRPYFDVNVMAVVAGYGPEELIGSIIQGDRKLIVLAEDLIEAQVPLDIRKGDKVVVRGRELNIEAADDNTRRISGVLLALELQVRG